MAALLTDSPAGGSSSKSRKRTEVERTDLPSIARDYAYVNHDYPPERFDIPAYPLRWGSAADYQLYEMVGRGAYGEVYRAVNYRNNLECVVKTIKPDKEEKVKIQREVLMLNLMRDGPNMVQLIDLVRDPETKIKMLVFEYIPNPDYKSVFSVMREMEIRRYLYETLKAIHYTHSKGVIHRDIKPRNILYNPDDGELRLIDWGFGEFYWPEQPIKKWPGTRNYKAPELLLHYEYYDYGVDMWAFGCIVGALVLARNPMFRCKREKEDRTSRMMEIVKVLGSEGLFAYMEKFKMNAYEHLFYDIQEYPRPSWYKLAKNNPAPDGVDLLDKLLRWDHTERLTAREALDHPYFDVVKKEDQYSDYTNYTGEFGDLSGDSYSYEDEQSVPAASDGRRRVGGWIMPGSESRSGAGGSVGVSTGDPAASSTADVDDGQGRS